MHLGILSLKILNFLLLCIGLAESAEFTLPAGDPDNGNLLIILIYISDLYGASIKEPVRLEVTVSYSSLKISLGFFFFVSQRNGVSLRI